MPDHTEAKFATVFRVCPDFITITNCATGRYLDVNDAFSRIMGYGKADVIGRTSAEIGIWESIGERQRMLEALTDSLRLENFEVRIRRKNGEVIVAQLSVERATLGGEDCLVIVGRDVSDRKRVEQALTDSETRFRLAMEASNDGLWDWDLLNDNAYFSPAYFRLLGYAPDELPMTGQTWIDLIHPDDLRRTQSANQECIENQVESFAVEFRMRAKDGSWKWILGRGMAFSRDQDGRAVRMIGTHLDITERKSTEDRLRHIANHLRESEQRYRSLFNNAEVAMFRSRLDGSEVLDCNDKFLEIVGRAREDVIGSPSRILWKDPQERERMVVQLQANGRVSDFEYQMLGDRGELRWCITSLRLFKDQGILEGSIRDITERKRAEKDMLEKNESLKRSNADLEQFAYVASHDLQTPLRNMVRYAQLLEHRYKGQIDADADDFIEFIVDGGKHMTRLINDLLEFSRVSRQSEPLRPIPAGEAVAQALKNLELELSTTRAEVIVGDLPVVVADQVYLVSLFQNLLENGLKYRAPDRKPVLSIHAERMSFDCWRFTVSDNGIGIEPQYHDKIFEIFQRLNPVSNTDGTGIGLTLCRRIVHRFGGTIWLKSDPGKGTTFLFILRDGSIST